MSGCHDHVSNQAETRRALISCHPSTDTAWLICKTSAKKKKKSSSGSQRAPQPGIFCLGDITSGWEKMWFFTQRYFSAWRTCWGEKNQSCVSVRSVSIAALPFKRVSRKKRNSAILLRNDADRRLQRWRTNGKQVDLCYSGGLHSSEECETATAGVWTETGCHIITTHGPQITYGQTGMKSKGIQRNRS